METFITLLEKRVADCSSLLCIGLDPHEADLPRPNAAAALDFCLELVRQTARYAAAFKPNAAFFEVFGRAGWGALQTLVAEIRASSGAAGSRIPVILDAKRGDIASTATAYAKSAFRVIGADAITLSPYLGLDALEPFLNTPEKGAFVLCKTSNPGSADLQDLQLTNGSRLFEHVARLMQARKGQKNLGLVVGATDLGALRLARLAAPDLWFLVPGIGAQGGDLHQAMQAGLRSDGSGLLINVSRSISQAANPGQVAAELRDEILNAQYAIGKRQVVIPAGGYDAQRALLMDGLLQAGCVKFGQFTLKSGLISPIYLDLRELVSYPGLLGQAAAAYLPLLKPLAYDRLAALPYAALPIGTAISLQSGTPLLYPRKESKSYGTRADIEGHYEPGDTVVVIDDLATTGSSKFEAIEKLTQAGLKVSDVVVLIDRQSGAKEALAQAGYRLHAVLNLSEMLAYWQTNGRVPSDQIAAARRFLAGMP